VFALYNINDELKLWKNKYKKKKPATNEAPPLVFDPEALNETIDDWNLDLYTCSGEEQKRYGRLASEVRIKIRNRAGAKEEEERKGELGEEEGEVFPEIEYNRSYTRKKDKVDVRVPVSAYIEPPN
jgi:hypothetical protein